MQVALITGAGSGIGKATALLFAAQGIYVGALGRTRSELEQTLSEIQFHGGQAMALEADISDSQRMQAAVEQLVERWGRLDSVFANAGINGVWAPIEELALEEWEKTK